MTNFRTSIGLPPLWPATIPACATAKKKRQSFTITTGDVPETGFGHDGREFIIESGEKKSPFEAGRSSDERVVVCLQVYRGRHGQAVRTPIIIRDYYLPCRGVDYFRPIFQRRIRARQHVNAIVCVHKTKGLLINNSGGGEDALAEDGCVGVVAGGWKP